mmetsp:Transcript_14650/g.59619  ORF Transcript_14650/g.59619 Transcript_14650/m.59619 type:complete len:512 (-) Transcript_14650:2242-3777(-)
MDRVSELLVPLRLGIGVSGGCDRSLHAIQAYLSCVPDSVVLRLDLGNAFNRIDRRLAKQLVDRHFPELAPVYRLGYGSGDRDPPTLCGWRSSRAQNQADTTRLTLRAATGVQQGDPLGPVLHALSLAPFLRALRAKFLDETIVAIHDDITIVGPLQALKAALAWGQTVLPSLGARLQLGKCTVYGRTLTTSRLVSHEIPGVRVTRDGVTIHSIPIGSRRYIEEECRALQNKHEKLFAEIARLPAQELTTQISLFRFCAETRLDYVLRCLAYEFGTTLAREADTMTRYHLEILFGGLATTAFEDEESAQVVADQIALPCRWGGLGFATRRRVQPIAFYSAWRNTFRNNQGAWPHVTELEQAVLAEWTTTTETPLELQWSTARLAGQICASARAIERRLGPETPPRILQLATPLRTRATAQEGTAEETTAWNNGSLQQTLSREAHHCAFQRLVSTSRISPENRARIRSAAGSGSGVWLREIPTLKPKKLTAAEMHMNLRQLLGLPIPRIVNAA